MNFLDKMKNKFEDKQYVAIKSLDYMEGGFLKKLSTTQILGIGLKTEDSDNKAATDKFIDVLVEHIYDDNKKLAFSDKDFLSEMPIGDLISIFEELTTISGAKTDIEKKKKS